MWISLSCKNNLTHFYIRFYINLYLFFNPNLLFKLWLRFSIVVGYWGGPTELNICFSLRFKLCELSISYHILKDDILSVLSSIKNLHKFVFGIEYFEIKYYFEFFYSLIIHFFTWKLYFVFHQFQSKLLIKSIFFHSQLIISTYIRDLSLYKINQSISYKKTMNIKNLLYFTH